MEKFFVRKEKSFIGLTPDLFSPIPDRRSNDGEHGHLADVRAKSRSVPRKVGPRRAHSGTEH
jgi:hypothetical protein